LTNNKIKLEDGAKHGASSAGGEFYSILPAFMVCYVPTATT